MKENECRPFVIVIVRFRMSTDPPKAAFRSFSPRNTPEPPRPTEGNDITVPSQACSSIATAHLLTFSPSLTLSSRVGTAPVCALILKEPSVPESVTNEDKVV